MSRSVLRSQLSTLNPYSSAIPSTFIPDPSTSLNGSAYGNRTRLTADVVLSGSCWSQSLGVSMEVQGVSCTTCTKKQSMIMAYLYRKNRSPFWYIQYVDSDRKKHDKSTGLRADDLASSTWIVQFLLKNPALPQSFRLCKKVHPGKRKPAGVRQRAPQGPQTSACEALNPSCR